jgi:hypothetical protein
MGTEPDSTTEVLAGLVERVTFHSEESGFCVLRVKTRGHRDLVTTVGHASMISAGEWITASGTWLNDRTHGLQFKAHFLNECFVTGYGPIIPSLDLPDPGDRHVLAAAIRASAQVIVTENRRDFPAAVLEEYGIETLGADDMLVSTYELFPSEAARALSRVRKRYRTPPMTASEFLFDLTKSGLPKLAATLRHDLEAL